jgi:metal-responsive CopG/Arc/MetJ family transcriptional regulator
MTNRKVTITMDDELYKDVAEVVSDQYNYGFKSRGHLISVAVDELLHDRGYYIEDDDEEDEDDEDIEDDEDDEEDE